MELDRTPLYQTLNKRPAPKFFDEAGVLRENRARPYASSDLVGLELEMENLVEPVRAVFRADHMRRWASEVDRSLLDDPNSYELRFRYPLRTVALTRALRTLREAMDAATPEQRARFSSFRTSTHIHLNMMDAVNDDMLALMYLYYATEPMFISYYASINENRDSNVFCIPLNKCHFVADAVRRMFVAKKSTTGTPVLQLSAEIRNLVDRMARRSHRYSALNICSLSTFGSIEFRAAPLLTAHEDLQDLVKVMQLLKQAARAIVQDREQLSNMLSGNLRNSETPAFSYLAEYFHSHGYGGLFSKVSGKLPPPDLLDAEYFALSLVGE